jgi:putative FmdB family regulatory protein
MPTYDYRCVDCGKTFTRDTSVAEHDAGRPACPKCGSQKVSQAFSAVYVKTSKKS